MSDKRYTSENYWAYDNERDLQYSPEAVIVLLNKLDGEIEQLKQTLESQGDRYYWLMDIAVELAKVVESEYSMNAVSLIPYDGGMGFRDEDSDRIRHDLESCADIRLGSIDELKELKSGRSQVDHLAHKYKPFE